ncbi:FAST kinase domain-containing protein 4 isoform X2 [Syngnathoides biaculeatus]|uniref:FAST kinase domain-containing protein 4 isoform X2 n=1 Tax=Syngnathoides biaculeatus TaxID=300417 RepID=UPI002ADDA841|nr:FAST kinase domain-containing protein 4 isoform X2 [Syngnathoides biaculeatus]
MAARFLGRYARLLCRTSSQASAACLPPSAAGLAELQRTRCRPYVSERSMRERGAQAREDAFLSMPTRTQLEETVEKAAVPEDVLRAWEQHGGNGNQAACTLLAWTRIVQKTQGKFPRQLAADTRLRDMMDIIPQQISTVWNSTLVSILRALWVIGVPETDPLLASIQTEVLWRIRRLSYKHLGFLAEWGTSRKAQQDVAIVNSALKQLELRWTEISDAKTVSGLISKGQHLSPVLMDRLEDKALELAEGFSAEEIRKVCVSLAALGRRSVALLRALSYHLLQRPSSEFTTPLLLDMAFAYGKLNFHQSQAFQRMASELMPRVSELTSSDVTRFAKSMGFLKWLHVPLFEAFAEHYMEHSEKYSNLQLWNMLMTFARLNFQPSRGEEFYAKVHPVLENSFSGLEPFLQTDVAWSLCVVQQAKPDYLIPLLQQEHVDKLSDGSAVRVENYKLKLLHLAATLNLEHPGSSSARLDALHVPASASAPSPLQSSLREALAALVDGRTAMHRTGVTTVYGWTIDCEVVVDSDNKPIELSQLKAPHLPTGGGKQALPEGARRHETGD